MSNGTWIIMTLFPPSWLTSQKWGFCSEGVLWDMIWVTRHHKIMKVIARHSFTAKLQVFLFAIWVHYLIISFSWSHFLLWVPRVLLCQWKSFSVGDALVSWCLSNAFFKTASVSFGHLGTKLPPDIRSCPHHLDCDASVFHEKLQTRWRQNEINSKGKRNGRTKGAREKGLWNWSAKWLEARPHSQISLWRFFICVVLPVGLGLWAAWPVWHYRCENGFSFQFGGEPLLWQLFSVSDCILDASHNRHRQSCWRKLEMFLTVISVHNS